MITFLKGLLVCFLLLPFAIYILNGMGNGDTDDMIDSIKKHNSFLLNLYLIYYPIVGLAILIGGILFMGIYALGTQITIF